MTVLVLVIHTLNIAHEINDKGDEVLRQIIEHLRVNLPGEAEISEIEAGIAKMTAKEVTKEEAVKEEFVIGSARAAETSTLGPASTFTTQTKWLSVSVSSSSFTPLLLSPPTNTIRFLY
jgi:hypothetical protein